MFLTMTSTDESGQSSNTFLMPIATLTPTPTTTSTVAAAATTELRLGPGLVIAPTASTTYVTPPSPESSTSTHHPYPAPVRKLAIIASLFFGIVTFTILFYAFAQRRRAKPDLTEPPERPPLGARQEKEKTVDIVQNFPRSKFSVTSSDYAFSIHSVLSDFELEGDEVEPERRRQHRQHLLSPSEFFSPSPPKLRESRHLRSGSEPVWERMDPPRWQAKDRRSLSVSVEKTRVAPGWF